MIFETDDMIFVYKPEGRASCAMTREISYWFAKQDFKHMLQEENDFLQKLNIWRPVENWKVPQFYLQRVQTEQKTHGSDSILSWLRNRHSVDFGAL